jgi:hypothetical protein
MTKQIIAAICIASIAQAQDATIVYRLGKDTVAIEQFTKSATKLTGEMVTRSGAAVTRTSYAIDHTNGKVTHALVKRMNAEGAPLAGTPNEYHLIWKGDSVTRILTFADSAPQRTFYAPNAFPNLPVYVYAPFELLKSTAKSDSVPAVGITGNAVGYLGFANDGGDIKLRGAPYAMIMKFDAQGRLQGTDGVYTTNKAIGTRVSGKIDIASVAKAMKPTGVLSPRMTAHATFQQGPIFINYGSPAVRGRTVWGGVLVPFDTIWRTGANEAAHLANSKTIQLGDMTLAPGLYTIWTQHTQNGTWLIVNKQVGQWGTGYNAAHDVGRVQMTLANTPEHVEDFTITIRAMPQNRGAIDMAWGDKVATATFQLR